MLVCHIAGCARVTDSTTGIPDPGEAGCDPAAHPRHPYIATVHRYLAAYAAPNAPAGPICTGLPDPAPVHRRRHAAAPRRPHQPRLPHPRHPLCPDQITAASVPRRTGRSAPPTAGTPILKTRRSDHPKGRACDLFRAHPDSFATGTNLVNGWRIATWLRAHAAACTSATSSGKAASGTPTRPTRTAGEPYTGGGIYDPADATGGHYDHIHLSVTDLSPKIRISSEILNRTSIDPD